ncbi:MAG: hypothetical protein IJR82_00365 [Bacilli bacterium]|nr:hypothetical protein [Bacilli bacterium]
MELAFENYCFNLKYGCINCIIGNGLPLEKLSLECQENNNVEMICYPVTNCFLYKTVKKQLEFSFENSHRHNKDKIIDVFKIIGLDESYLNRRIDTLSSSELYLIALACVFIVNPQIIIFDNPDKYLDINHLNVFLKAIRTIKRRYKKTIIIFSNDSDFVHMIADYMFVIDKSGVLKEGNKYDVFSDVKIIKDLHLDLPKIIHLENLVLKEKKIDIGFRDNINDLIKDIYYFSN